MNPYASLNWKAMICGTKFKKNSFFVLFLFLVIFLNIFQIQRSIIIKL
jgi:hypothetical protein